MAKGAAGGRMYPTAAPFGLTHQRAALGQGGPLQMGRSMDRNGCRPNCCARSARIGGGCVRVWRIVLSTLAGCVYYFPLRFTGGRTNERGIAGEAEGYA